MKPLRLKLIALVMVQLFIMLPLHLVQAVTITNVRVDATGALANVSWSTNIQANGTIRYGRSGILNNTVLHSDLIINHSLMLQPLDAETNYVYEIISDANNSPRATSSGSFWTKDSTPPPITTGLKNITATSKFVDLAWDKNTAADLFRYTIYRNNLAIANSTANSYKDASVQDDTSYAYQVSAFDKSGNEGPKSPALAVKTPVADRLPPKISNVEITASASNSFTLSWNTDEESNSMVYYGTSQASLDNVAAAGAFELNHTVTVSNLENGTLYFYKAGNCDRLNNCANDTIRSITAGLDLAPPEIIADIPAFFNNKIIDITGKVEPKSIVKLYVDGSLNRQLSSLDTNAGNLRFLKVDLKAEGRHSIRINARDIVGNVNEKTYDIFIDSKQPKLNVEGLSDIMTSVNINITGSIDEAGVIRIFASSEAEDRTAPPKVLGLAKTAVDMNSVKLTWEIIKEGDFAGYIIYRNDVAIAIAEPNTYNTYTDVLVNSGVSYTYKVSAMDTSGNEGLKSEPVSVSIPEGGRTNIPAPKSVNLASFAKFARQEIKIDSPNGGVFNTTLTVDEGDGKYTVKIEAVDKAGNTVSVEKSILLDTHPPEIEILDPRQGTFIYETTANDLTIKGKTEPFAEVHLFIDRSPLGQLDARVDISSSLLDALKAIPEDRLRASCRLEAGGKTLCRTGADYTTEADENGDFQFKKVDVVSGLAGGISITRIGSPSPPGDIGPSAPQEPSLDEESPESPLLSPEETPLLGPEEFRTAIQRSDEARLMFIATDVVGQRAVSVITYRLGTCWSGNFSWNVVPLQEFQSPGFLNVERIADGTETIYFFLNMTYIGIGNIGVPREDNFTQLGRTRTDSRLDNKVAAVQSFSLQKACDEVIIKDPKYSISCEILQSCTVKSNEDRTLHYVACPLRSYQKFKELKMEEWKDFFKALGNEMVFPFQLRIGYISKTRDNRVTTQFQTSCMPVTYALDASKVDFERVLPDWLLFDAVEWLDSSIQTLDTVIVELQRILDYLGLGCIASFGMKFVLTIFRRYTCYMDGYQDTVKKLFESKEEKQDNELPCPRTEQEQKKLSNTELKRDCDRCAAAWESEEKVYKLYRGLCDRVFCHTSPAAWTSEATEEDIQDAVIRESQNCGSEDDVKGQKLKEASCSNAFDEDDIRQDIITENNAGDNCYRATVKEGAKRPENLVFIKTTDTGYASDKIYLFENVAGYSSAISPSYQLYAREVNGKYMTARPESCKDLCASRGYEGYSCGTTQSCSDINVDPLSDETAQQRGSAWDSLLPKSSLDDKAITYDKQKDYSASKQGYTSDCIFGNKGVIGSIEAVSRPPLVTGTDPKETTECCCINSAGAAGSGPYYQANDVSIYPKDTAQKVQAHEIDEETGNIKWSYRYWKVRYPSAPPNADRNKPEFQHTRYNPYKYYSERDSTACFGQENVLLSPESVMHDPFKNHISAFQCLCVSGIYNRLVLIRNMMTALRNCLITVRETGTADSGACKELFSQYVCSLIYQLISMFRQGCIGFDGADPDADESEFEAVFKGGTDAIFGGVQETQNELAEEYGNAQLNNLIGGGEEAIARKACLAAFGYDWEIGLQDVLDASYSTPFATLVQAVNARREYLTFDPFEGTSSYDYRAAWLINPGCDFDDYDVHLSCVSLKDIEQHPDIRCDEIEDPEGSGCDCINLNDEIIYRFYDGAGLRQNVVEDKDKNEVIKDDYRYDHLKIVLRPQIFYRGARPATYSANTQRCFPEGHEDGVFYFPLRDVTAKDIVSCYVDATSGQFRCLQGDVFFGTKGQAYFLTEQINNQNAKDGMQIAVGDSLELTPTIYKAVGPDVCLEVALKSNVQGERENVIYVPVNVDGRIEYPPIKLADAIGLTSKGILQYDSRKIETKILGQPKNTNNMDIIVGFESPDQTYAIAPESEDVFSITAAGITVKKPLKELANYQTSELMITVDRKINIEVLKPQEQVKLTIENVRSLTQSRDGKSWVHQDTIRITPAISTRETRTLSMKLLRLKEGNKTYGNPNECNPSDVVVYQGTPQQKEYRIMIASDMPSLRDVCKEQGYKEEAVDCICGSNQGDASGLTEEQIRARAKQGYTKNCGPNFKGKFCYASGNSPEQSCHEVPRCYIDKFNNRECDCNLDGTLNKAAEPGAGEAAEDCFGTFKYCYDNPDRTGGYECFKAQNPGMDTTKPVISSMSVTNVKTRDVYGDIERAFEIAEPGDIKIKAFIVDKESSINKVELYVQKSGEAPKVVPEATKELADPVQEYPYESMYIFREVDIYDVWVEASNGNGQKEASPKWRIKVTPSVEHTQ